MRRWRQNDRGVVAVEFAMIALPFFVLLFGMIEMALAYTASYMLEGGVVEAARLLRTGEATDSGDAESAFRTKLCDQVGTLIPCGDIVYESIPLDGFSSAADAPPQYDENGNLVSQGFNAGSSDSVVMVRAFYRYYFMTPFIADLIGDSSGSSIAMMSTAVIRNEPYSFNGG